MINFYKYQGAGNDFLLIDNRDKSFGAEDTEKIKLMCDRHFGIGADGLILLEASEKVDSAGSPQADCFMNYFNSDGTVAEMCGNGVRCLAKFFLDQTKSLKRELSIDTRTGIKTIVINSDETFSVNMGAPVFSHKDFPASPLILQNISFDFVSMGNPHAVGFVADVNQVNLLNIGPKIENDSHFPNKINAVDFENWVQERSTYQAENIDTHFETPLAMSDKG
ncbi:MAG: diaminopimelate epimerase, partial [bacterium]